MAGAGGGGAGSTGGSNTGSGTGTGGAVGQPTSLNITGSTQYNVAMGGLGGSTTYNPGLNGANGKGGGGYGIYSSGGPSGSGGSGRVYLKMLTENYSGNTTGSPGVSTTGAYTVLTFTGSGTYTT